LRDLMGCNFPFPRGRVCCVPVGPHWGGQFHIRSLYTYVTSSVVTPRKVLWSGHYSLGHLTPPLLPKCNALTFPLYKSDQSRAWTTQCNSALTLQNFINKHTTNSENVQGNRKTTRINLQNANTNKLDVKISFVQQPTSCNRSRMTMGASWRGESQEITRPITTTRLKIEDACILCNATMNWNSAKFCTQTNTS
jgi:hypothetical protein